jgi:hypothetical protein
MWTVVYMSQSAETSEKLMAVLSENKVMSKLRRSNYSREKFGCYEVLVPSTELEASQDLIFENELF